MNWKRVLARIGWKRDWDAMDPDVVAGPCWSRRWPHAQGIDPNTDRFAPLAGPITWSWSLDRLGRGAERLLTCRHHCASVDIL